MPAPFFPKANRTRRILSAGIAAILISLSIAVPAFSIPTSKEERDAMVTQLKELSKKVERIEKQNEQMLEDHKKIFDEFQTVKIRIRRKS